MDFIKLQPEQHPRLTSSNAQRSESRYWREFRNPIFVKSYAPISHITFSRKAPHRYCISSGTKIQIYSPKTMRVVKTISRFQVPARFSDIKSDGKLVVSSDDSGLVQVFDLNSRAILRSFNEHKQPVHVARFSPHSANILTCSDDSTVRIYDLATSKAVRTFVGHSDYVRSGNFASANLIVSGSYDGTLYMWDDRVQENQGLVWSLSHNEPIESILIHPTGTLLVSAGGPVAKVWDILGASGNKSSLIELTNHQKTITCLSWARGPFSHSETEQGNSRRLLSGGLDGLVKVYDTSTGSYKVQHTIRYGSPILSMAISPDDSLLVVGCTDGSLSMRKRVKTQTEIEASKAERGPKSASTDHMLSKNMICGEEIVWGRQENNLMEEMAHAGNESSHDGIDQDGPEPQSAFKPPAGAMTTLPITSSVKRKKKQRLQTWDKMLRAFRYGDALDSVLAPVSRGVISQNRPEIVDPRSPLSTSAIQTVPPNTTFSLFRELIHRDGLHLALSGRDEVSLGPILRFISRHITDPRWFNIGSDVLKCIIELYQPVLGKSQTIDSLFSSLSAKISEEIKLHSALFGINGQLEMILSNFDR